jgi:hypothetical protein
MKIPKIFSNINAKYSHRSRKYTKIGKIVCKYFQDWNFFLAKTFIFVKFLYIKGKCQKKNFENGNISIIFAKNENLLRVSENRTSLDDVREKKGILVFQPKSQLTTSRSKTSFFIVAKRFELHFAQNWSLLRNISCLRICRT